MSERPFRVLGVQQIAVGHADKQRLLELWVELLGLNLGGSYRSETENVDEDIALLGTGPHAVEIDLMQPIDPNRSPRVHEPALNHVGLWVDDLDAAQTWLSARGMRFAGGIRVGAGGHRVLFIHPKPSSDLPRSGEGVLIELVEAPVEVRAALERPRSAT
ncbi:MAG TPA: VOC family protein [Polyangiaceae bacterium]|nr:VOC family protein [Polyangiaceae bacterium]